MFIYSETSFAFIHRCEQYTKDIMRYEVNLPMERSRFLYQGVYYPLSIVVFEGQNKLGFFDPTYYQLGLNQALMYSTKDKVLKDIIRHELAHYLTLIFYGPECPAHGEEFKVVCHRFGWASDVSYASADITLLNQKIEGDLKAEQIIHKVQKLLKLAQSDNIHEAEQATLKANQLLLRYNIDKLQNKNEFETLFVARAISCKRKNAKLTAIYDIIKHFMVSPILRYGRGEVSLEVTGTKANIELALYIADFLNLELERLWQNFSKQHNSKGSRAKNSFYQGMAKGHAQKMEQTLRTLNSEDSKALIAINQELKTGVKKIYRRISSTSSNALLDETSFNAGKMAGAKLTINKAIKNNTKTKLIGWFK
jgi:hypothetical protein